jgi:hypothetical protein
MNMAGRYLFDYAFIAIVTLTSILGFWSIYFDAGADPQPHHHLHVATTFVWLGLVAFQLSLADRGRFATHRKAGLVVLGMGPLLVATTAMLSVHSAHRALASGGDDFLIVQNVMGTLELGLLIVMAFVMRKRRKVHASFLLSTLILFLGISSFFALISFAPPFKIEGPETFGRFQTAAMTAQAIAIAAGAVLFIRDVRNNWPFLIAGLFFALNELIKAVLASLDLMAPLTTFVGSLSQPYTFVATFAVVFLLLAANGVQIVRRQPSAT